MDSLTARSSEAAIYGAVPSEEDLQCVRTPANRVVFLSLPRGSGNSDLRISFMENFDSDLIRFQLHDSMRLARLSESLTGRIAPESHGQIGSCLHRIRVSSEDDLSSYIGSRPYSDSESLNLHQFVRFKYLSAECVSAGFCGTRLIIAIVRLCPRLVQMA
jgi:hypothetical protein